MVNDAKTQKSEKINNNRLVKANKKNNKIPKEISQQILKKMFRSLLKAVCITLYFIILNLAYTAIKEERLVNDIKVFSGVFLIVGLYFLEKAYKEDSGIEALSGIEFFVLSLHSLSIMHIITLFQYDFRLYLLTSSYIFSIYFVLKSIILYTKGRKEYLQGLSDISEIVQKDEPIKKEAKKRIEHNQSKEESSNIAKRKKKKKVANSKLHEERKISSNRQEEIKRPVKKKIKNTEKEEPSNTSVKKKKVATKTVKHHVEENELKTAKNRTSDSKLKPSSTNKSHKNIESKEKVTSKKTKTSAKSKKEEPAEQLKRTKTKKQIKKKENE